MSDEALPLLDNPDAPIIYADELSGGGSHQLGNASVVFSVLQYDHSVSPPRAYRRVCLRLIMPKVQAGFAADFMAAVAASPPSEETAPPRSAMN